MVSVEKQAISDFSEIFQENYDRFPAELKQLKKEFRELNMWLIKPTTEEQKKEHGDYAIYQYLPETQEDFMDHQSMISSISEAVFMIVKDVNEISAVGTSTFTKSTDVQSQSDNPAERQIINVNTGKPSVFGKLRNPFSKPPQTNLPKSVEDFWVMSENWKVEIMNIPNIWGKYLDWHHMGVLRHSVFDGDGMELYLKGEITYLNTRIEPQITKIVRRALELKIDKEITRIGDIYMNTLQSEKDMELAKIQTGQTPPPEQK